MSRKMDYSRIRRKPVEMDIAKIQKAFAGTSIVMIFTDGSCLKNLGGNGGWAAIVRRDKKDVEMFGSESETTSNRMEMTAAIMGLEYLSKRCTVIIATDSQYLIQGATKWISGWRQRGWKTQDGQPVKNRDLWLRIEILCERHEISWQWVRGHNGHVENERCDYLAGRAALEKIAQ